MSEAKEGQKKTKNLKYFERYSANPSSARHKIEDLSIGTRPVPQKKIVVDGDEVIDEFTENGWPVKVHDNKQFIKLFEGAQTDLVKLSSSGIAVFTYILLNLNKIQDQITIPVPVFGKWYKSLEGCEKANEKMIHYRGIIDLLTHEFIYLKTGEGSYFVNVNKFFNGDRKKIWWVAEIDDKLKNKISVPKKAVEYDPNYVELNKD